MTPIETSIAARILRHGPLPFSEVMRASLYDPDHGFYSSGGAAGRRGDFITSAEVGPLFGTLIGRALDRTWRRLGEPDPFVVVEAAAGVGTLARTVLHGEPDCLPALTYVLVEQSPALRARQGEHLRLVDPAHALRPDGEGTRTSEGPSFVPLADLPTGPYAGVVLANELLDNLPVDLVERTDDGWCEVRVGLADDDRTLVEQPVPAPEPVAARAVRHAPDAAVGARLPLATDAAVWVRRAQSILDRGELLLFDYGDTSASLAGRPATEWLRTYRGHERGGPPLEALGTQDITCEVPWDQVVPGATVRLQADVLRELGVDELVEEGRRTWEERAHLGDLAAVKGRSRINEAAALLDPSGLGAFGVVTIPAGA